MKSNLTYVYKVGKSYIMPGLNFIDDESILEHPHIQHHIKNKTIELLPDYFKEKNNTDYNSMNVKKLTKQIKEIYDVKLLEKIKRSDSRQSIIDAIDKQIEKIKSDDGE